MKRPRSEMFYVNVPQAWVPVFLGKQASLKVRPVRRIVAYLKNDIAADPTTFDSIADAVNLANYTITLRDSKARDLMVDVPVWMFGESQQFTKPNPYGPPIMHGRRNLADLPIDPQKSTVRCNRGDAAKKTIALEFIYTP